MEINSLGVEVLSVMNRLELCVFTLKIMDVIQFKALDLNLHYFGE